MFRGRILEWLRWSLLIAGCLTLGYTGAEWASGRIEQAKASRELDRILFEQAAKSEPPAAKYIADGSLIGKVEIPDLHLSAVVD
jgi:sortase (surface protein transpeptidase)